MEQSQCVSIIFLSLQLLMHNGKSDLEGTNSMFAAKMIQTEYEQIFECINVNSQPSLRHPLLRDHIVQMRPTSFADSLDADLKSKFSYEEVTINYIACPMGTVPILRNYGRNSTARSFKMLKGYMQNEYKSTLHTVMVATLPATVHGSIAMITVYEPNVGISTQPRYSGAVVQIQNGVDPHLYGDNHSHFEIAWSDNNHGCINLLCKGFVQVSSQVAPRAILNPASTINGTQYVIAVELCQKRYLLSIMQDTVTGNWWLTYGNESHPVGYWPKELFSYLADAANEIGWFGVVGAAHGESCPPMGSGEWPDEGEGKAAYFAEVKIVDERTNVVVPNLKDCVVQITDPKCYQVGRVNALDEGLHFYFGGPECPSAG
ncbi:protein neprosin-like [Phragmites australis]|uniref:protein neprosin-like n=1 Tax=Phragmites australis TaxID=29695 RepID=UPI002D78AD21|nr:protein neprosin-like [Phragmites australis]